MNPNISNNIHQTAQNVVDAVNIISSQRGCSQEQFHQANLIVSSLLANQDFKFMFDIGAYLIQHNSQYDANVLNFALKLIETAIRLHWKYINNATKDELKAFLESILQDENSNSGITHSQPLLAINGDTPRHILNSLSKCFCEVIKCDWPGEWPQLFDKLMATKNNLVVVFILLRLAEDVGTFCEPADNLRRREISKGLDERIINIYSYLVDCISSGDLNLIRASLECLTALSTWARYNGEMTKFLCQIIKELQVSNPGPSSSTNLTIVDFEMKRSACEVLIAILERKHSKPDSIDVRTSLFEDETNLSNLIMSLKQINQLSMMELTQEKFELEKKLSQIFAHIVRYVPIGPPEKPQNLKDIYDVMKIMLTHPSITVSIQAVHFWLKVFTYFPKKPVASIPQELTASLLVTCATKLVKCPYDSQLYGFELDCPQEYEVFQSKYRNDLGELCRHLTSQDEAIGFDLVCNSLAKALQQSNTSIYDWDALSSLSSSVCSRLTVMSHFQNGMELVKLLLISIDKKLMQASNLQSNIGSEASNIPDIISAQLSCISALTIFLPQWHYVKQDLTKQVLNKIILLAFHRPDKTNASSRQLVGNNTILLQNESFLKGFKALSRHASACFVRICLNHSKHLMNIFEVIKNDVDSLFATATDNPYSSEKCQLYEGLAIIGNEQPNDMYRKKFALELLSTVDWFRSYELDCDQFIDFVGLNRIEGEQESSTGFSHQELPKGQLNRVKLTYVVNFLTALTRRLNTRQTLLPELLSFVKPVLNILHSMHSLWLPEMQVKCLKDYHKVLFAQVSSSYRQQILDTILVNQKSSNTDNSNYFNSEVIGDIDNSNRTYRGEAQYIDLFSWNFYESLLSCVGSIITKGSPDLFSVVSNVHLQTALRGAEYLPPLKLHKLIKSFIMPLVTVSCRDPILIEQQLLPLLSNFLPFMFNQLETQWKLYKENDNLDNDNCSQPNDLADEMVRNHLLRNLSKDFIDLMNMILVEKAQSTSTTNTNNKDALHRSISNTDVQNTTNETDLFKISNLGLNLLSARPDFVIIVMTSTLTWSDSSLNTKSITINSYLIKHLLAANLIKTFDETSLLFRNIITSLGMFGEHEQNCAGLVQLFLQLYEGLKKTNNFSQHIVHLTNIDAGTFAEYESKTAYGNDKTKRSQMRKVLDKLIGKNIGQRYKVEAIR